jgi:hypothetical protein
LFSNDLGETREVNSIAVRMAYDELKANGWDLNSTDGQKMIVAGATAHILDAVYEYDCRWDVRFTRWIRGLPPRKRFASAVEILRDFRKEVQERRPVAPESKRGPAQILTFFRRHPNLSFLAAGVLVWWLAGKFSVAYDRYHFEHDWLIIEPPAIGINDFRPNLEAPTEEWDAEHVCPSWIACQRLLKAEQACAAMSRNGSKMAADLYESASADHCIARADPLAPDATQPEYDRCDPEVYSVANCTPRNIVHSEASRQTK